MSHELANNIHGIWPDIPQFPEEGITIKYGYGKRQTFSISKEALDMIAKLLFVDKLPASKIPPQLQKELKFEISAAHFDKFITRQIGITISNWIGVSPESKYKSAYSEEIANEEYPCPIPNCIIGPFPSYNSVKRHVMNCKGGCKDGKSAGKRGNDKMVAQRKKNKLKEKTITYLEIISANSIITFKLYKNRHLVEHLMQSLIIRPFFQTLTRNYNQQFIITDLCNYYFDGTKKKDMIIPDWKDLKMGKFGNEIVALSVWCQDTSHWKASEQKQDIQDQLDMTATLIAKKIATKHIALMAGFWEFENEKGVRYESSFVNSMNSSGSITDIKTIPYNRRGSTIIDILNKLYNQNDDQYKFKNLPFKHNTLIIKLGYNRSALSKSKGAYCVLPGGTMYVNDLVKTTDDEYKNLMLTADITGIENVELTKKNKGKGTTRDRDTDYNNDNLRPLKKQRRC